MKVIGISGKAGHGKDYIAKLIFDIAEKKHAKKTLIWAFATPLKARVYGECRGEVTFEDIWYNKPPEIRERLQKTGTEGGRDVYGEDFWMLQTEAFIRVFAESGVELVIIPDVRFENEIMFCHLNGNAINRFDEECWQKARETYEYTPEIEQEYMKAKDLDGLIELEQDVGTLQHMLFEAKLSEGRVARVKSDRPTLEGSNANHSSEVALDEVSDLMFDWLLINNVETTTEEIREQLESLLDAYLGG